MTASYTSGDQSVTQSHVTSSVQVLLERSRIPSTCSAKEYTVFKLRVSSHKHNAHPTEGRERERERSLDDDDEDGEEHPPLDNGEGEGEGEEEGEGEDGGSGVSTSPPYPVHAHIRVRAVPLFSSATPKYHVVCGTLKIGLYTADANIGASQLPFDPEEKKYEVMNPPGLFGGFQTNNILSIEASRSSTNSSESIVDYFGLYFRSVDDTAIANLYFQSSKGSDTYVDPHTPLSMKAAKRGGYYLNLAVLSSEYGYWYDHSDEYAPNAPVSVTVEE